MATAAQAKTFIEAIAPLVQKYAPLFNIKVASPIIAQAILESDCGNSELGKYANNFFGLKYRAGRCPSAMSGYYVKIGSEQNPDGSYASGVMYWFKFANMEQCVKGYFEFINVSNYKNLKGVTDPYQYLKLIKEDGYATSLEYVTKVSNVIKSYNLTRFDTIQSGEVTDEQSNNNTYKEGNKMRINVHAGHNPDGKPACGAIGFIQESTENRKVKNEVIAQLRALGHTVYDTTCENGANSSDVLKKIVAACNAHSVDLDVSIHFNAGAKDAVGNGQTTGTEVFVYNTSGKAYPYAVKICKAIADLGFKSRGVKTSTSLYVLRNTKAPALLIECCFVDDKDDIKLYNYLDMATAIVYGITGQKVQKEKPTTDKDASAPGAETPTTNGKEIYRVQVGAYSNKTNAENMQKKLKAAGFDAVVVKA